MTKLDYASTAHNACRDNQQLHTSYSENNNQQHLTLDCASTARFVVQKITLETLDYEVVELRKAIKLLRIKSCQNFLI